MAPPAIIYTGMVITECDLGHNLGGGGGYRGSKILQYFTNLTAAIDDSVCSWLILQCPCNVCYRSMVTSALQLAGKVLADYAIILLSLK